MKSEEDMMSTHPHKVEEVVAEEMAGHAGSIPPSERRDGGKTSNIPLYKIAEKRWQVKLAASPSIGKVGKMTGQAGNIPLGKKGNMR